MRNFILFLMLSFGFNASAGIMMKDLRTLSNPEKLKSFCPKLAISKAQQKDIKHVIMTTRKQIKSHMKSMITAKRNFKKVIMNPTTTKEEALDAGMQLQKAMHPAKVIRKNAKLEVQFDILTGGQRVQLLKCKKAVKKVKKSKKTNK